MIDTEALRRKVLTLAIKGDLLTKHVQNSALSQIRKLSKELNGSDFKMVSDELTPFQIPSNWIWCHLSDIGTTNIGLTYHPEDVCEEGIPVLRSNNIQNNTMDYSDLIKVNCDIREKQYLYSNDILICSRNGSKNLVGKCAIYDGELGDVSFGAFMAVYRSKFYQYVYYFFLTSVFRSNFENENNKQINQVTQKILKDALIPIPPYEEQELIVSRIRALFDQIDILDTLQQQYASNITSLNKKILDLAVMGKLVPQDPNDEPASVLLKKIAEEKQKLIKEGTIKKQKALPAITEDEIPFDIPESWEWVRFSDVIEIESNLVNPEDYKDYLQIGPDCIEKGTGKLIKKRTVKDAGIASPNHLFFEGQIIYSKIRPNLRKVVLAPADGLCSADMYPLATKLNHQFLIYYMLTDVFTSSVLTSDTRALLPKVNQKQLSKVLIPIPPLKEQDRIQEKVTRILEILPLKF